MNKDLKPYEVNIYTCYHNLNVLVLYDNNESLKTVGEQKICLYIFEEDVSPSNCYTKLLSFNEFIKEVKKHGYGYIKYYYEECYVWHIDAVDAFTKEALDEYLNSSTEEEKKKYDFLQK